jgi:hypothetical protein
MNGITTAVIITSALFLAVFLGVRLRRLLPEQHLSADTKDAVKLAMGLIATMSALVLGLLVSSAKGTYDTERGQVIQMAAKIGFLDRVLELYGPDATQPRALLRTAVEEAVGRAWPQEKGRPPELAPDIRRGDEFYNSILALSVRDDTQRSLKAQALTLAMDLGLLRSQLLAQSVDSISKPLLVVVVCWLVVIFFSFSLLAPPNATAAVAFMVSAFSVSAAIFLILELDRPFGGLIQISSEPILKVLSQLGK